MHISPKLIRFVLTGLGIIGVPVTSYISVKCHEKAREVEDPKQKARCYIPAIISGAATCGCIGASHHVSSRQIGTLTATAACIATNRDKISEAVNKTLPKKQAEEIRKAASEATVASEAVQKLPTERTGFGCAVFLDPYTGRKFYSSIEQVLAAEERVESRLRRGYSVSVNEWYRYNGLMQTEFGEKLRWMPIENYYDKYPGMDIVGFYHRQVRDDDDGAMWVIEMQYPPEDDVFGYETDIEPRELFSSEV